MLTLSDLPTETLYRVGWHLKICKSKQTSMLRLFKGGVYFQGVAHGVAFILE
jgi:hypothetical protein